MSNLISNLVAATVNTELAMFGQPCTYSRPDSSTFDEVAPFTLTVSIRTGREYTDPLTKLVGEAFVRLSDIPLGPQKGDLITPSDPSFLGRTYEVREMWLHPSENHGLIMFRWPGPSS